LAVSPVSFSNGTTARVFPFAASPWPEAPPIRPRAARKIATPTSTTPTASGTQVRDRGRLVARTGAVIVGVVPPLGVASDSSTAVSSSAV
jgi:hypothetical protein